MAATNVQALLPRRYRPAKRYIPCSESTFRSATASVEDLYRPCLAGERVDHLALDDDYEFVLGLARFKRDLPGLRLPPLP